MSNTVATIATASSASNDVGGYPSNMISGSLSRAPVDAKFFTHVLGILDRIDPLHLSICMAAGLAVLVHALSHVRSVTARRQLRWIVWGTALGAIPFAVGYAIPWAAGLTPSLPMELSAVPLSLVPVFLGRAGLVYLVTALLLGGGFIYRADRLAVHQSNAMARRLLLASIVYLPLIFIVLVLDRA